MGIKHATLRYFLPYLSTLVFVNNQQAQFTEMKKLDTKKQTTKFLEPWEYHIFSSYSVLID